MQDCQTRREWLWKTASAIPGAYLSGLASARAAAAPAAPVAVAKCGTYDPAQLVPALSRLFDQLGGLGRVVKGKTVAVKINLTGEPTYRLGHLPLGDTHYTHPNIIAAVVHLMGRAGAKRIRLLESPFATADPVEEYIIQAGWEPRDILGAALNVEFENTNFIGDGQKKYSRFAVPNGGLLFPAYDLNHAYEDCDAFVTLAKMKEHATAGITLSMKNSFGIMPSSIYGSGAGQPEPDEMPKTSRGMIHAGNTDPAKGSPTELDPKSPRDGGYRVPRAIVDLVSARPIDLAVVEAVKTMAGGEGPWIRGPLSAISPGVLVAGTNPVTTDAVCMALMSYNPMADRGTPPFETCDSTLRLAEDKGLGTRDLKRIEVIGTPIAAVRFDWAALRRERRTKAAATGCTMSSGASSVDAAAAIVSFGLFEGGSI
jgi:uncharacterized protein (DUF362 family)